MTWARLDLAGEWRPSDSYTVLALDRYSIIVFSWAKDEGDSRHNSSPWECSGKWFRSYRELQKAKATAVERQHSCGGSCSISFNESSLDCSHMPICSGPTKWHWHVTRLMWLIWCSVIHFVQCGTTDATISGPHKDYRLRQTYYWCFSNYQCNPVRSRIVLRIIDSPSEMPADFDALVKLLTDKIVLQGPEGIYCLLINQSALLKGDIIRFTDVCKRR